MIEPFVRPYLQRMLVDPIADILDSQKLLAISPIFITSIAAILGIGSFLAILYQRPWLAVFLLLLSGLCDVLDGTLARKTNRSSDIGTVLDISCDRLVEFLVVLGLYCLAPAARGLICLLMLGSILLCVSTFLVVGIFTDNQGDKGFHYSPGLIERAEAFAFFVLMILLPQWFLLLAWLFTILVMYTATVRLYQFTKQQLGTIQNGTPGQK